MNFKISPHFYYYEVIKSQVASRLGIDNNVPCDIMEHIVNTAENILEPVRTHFGVPIVPSSWYRCEELNKAIGGSPTSQHIKGFAVDFEIIGVSNMEVAEYIVQNLDFEQLILEYYNPAEKNSGWLHVSYISKETNSNEVLRTTDGKNYTRGLT